MVDDKLSGVPYSAPGPNTIVDWPSVADSPDLETETDKPIVIPILTLQRLIETDAGLPLRKDTDWLPAEIRKSPTFTVNLTECDRDPLVPVTVRV